MEQAVLVPAISVLIIAVVALLVGFAIADRHRGKSAEKKVLRVTAIVFLALIAMGASAFVMLLLSN